MPTPFEAFPRLTSVAAVGNSGWKRGRGRAGQREPMKLEGAVIEELTVRPGERANLSGRSTESATVNWLGERGSRRKVAREDLRSFVGELETAQELLWASNTHALLVVLQAMDAAGKDGTIKHVMSGVNPQGCRVVAFRRPSDEALEHDFLWRYNKALPERGTHRDLQPLLLRGGPGGPGASGAPR